MKVDRVIKLGGSAITRKDELETVKMEQLKAAAKLVKCCVDRQLTCVLVHGAGSFGHIHAKEYSVVSGYKHLANEDRARAATGFAVTRQAVTKLNKLVVDSLISESLPAVSLSPFPCWRTRDAQVIRDGVSVIEELLGEGLIPVLHGDCCLDADRGWTILSGDTIIQTLCQKMTVDTVVFLTDVPGIYDRPPTDSDAAVLPHICVRKDGTLVEEVTTQKPGCDVTGGIRLKIDSAVRVVVETEGGTSVFVCGITTPVAQRVCLLGVTQARGEGTLIRLTQE